MLTDQHSGRSFWALVFSLPSHSLHINSKRYRVNDTWPLALTLIVLTCIPLTPVSDFMSFLLFPNTSLPSCSDRG